MRQRQGEMRIRLRGELCTGHARCNSVAATLFPLDEDGYSALEDTDVPPEFHPLAREGAAACPEGAITVGDLHETIAPPDE